MYEVSMPEAGLFLMFLSANFEWDPVTDSVHGELSSDEEEFILNCVNKLSFFRDFSLQEKLEEAIQKYNNLIAFSTSTAEVIQHCAKPLLASPAERDMIYFLCSEVVSLSGLVRQDSKEEKYLSKLDYYLKVDPACANTIYFIGVIRNALRSH